MILDAQGKPFDAADPKVIEAQAAAQTFNAKLSETRTILDMDMLASLINPSVHFERSFADCLAYFFTINGILNGKKIRGAMFAGQCILIFAPSMEQAADVAKRGLRSTVESAHEWYAENKRHEEGTILQQGSIVDAGGRRLGRATPASAFQAKKMEAMVRHVFGGEEWTW